MTFDEQVSAAVERAYGHYKAEAVKRGRNSSFPYVPLIRWSDGGKSQTQQIANRAFADRGDAINCAQRHIENLKRHLIVRLNIASCRALREQYGLPRELP